MDLEHSHVGDCCIIQALSVLCCDRTLKLLVLLADSYTSPAILDPHVVAETIRAVQIVVPVIEDAHDEMCSLMIVHDNLCLLPVGIVIDIEAEPNLDPIQQVRPYTAPILQLFDLACVLALGVLALSRELVVVALQSFISSGLEQARILIKHDLIGRS